VVDILHSVFRVVTLLMTAKPVGAASAEHMPELNKFHHEASLDDFYMISTVMDFAPEIDYYKSFEERKDSKGKDTFYLSDWQVSE
jgi:hypothetical protein